MDFDILHKIESCIQKVSDDREAIKFCRVGFRISHYFFTCKKNQWAFNY